MEKSAFMIMPFGDEIANDLYRKSTRPICEELSLLVKRADEVFSTNPIIEDIISEIRNAKVVIADVSGLNANVFYELGVAHVLKTENTILITREEFGKLPFDIRHLRIIKYEDSIKGKTEYETTFRKTLEPILLDLARLYEEEFELIENTLRLFGSDDAAVNILALKASKLPIHTTSNFRVAGHKEGTDVWKLESEVLRPSGMASIKLEGFVTLGYVEIRSGVFFTTKKGDAFCDLLKKKGYVADALNEQVFTEGFKWGK